MFRKVTLVPLVLFGFVLSGMTGECFADVAAKLEQAKSNIIFLIKKDDNNTQAKLKTQKLIASFSRHPDLPKALYEIADRYRWTTQYEQAKNLYDQIIKNHSNSPYASRAELGVSRVDVLSLIISQNYDQAEAAFDKLVADFSGHPDLPETFYWVAERYHWAAKYEQAKNLYAQIPQNHPDSPWAGRANLGTATANVFSLIESKQINQAKEALDKFVVDFAGHSDLPETLYWIARKYGWSHIYEEEKSVYEQIIKNNPDSSWASKAELGVSRAGIMSLIMSENYDQAEAALDKLVADFSEHPDLFDTLHWVAERFKWSGRYEQAENIYQQLIQNHPDSPYARRANLDISKTNVISLVAAKDYDRAEEALDKLITDFSGHPDLPDAVLEVVEPYYDEALRLEVEGLVNQSKDLFQKALAIYEKVKNSFPSHVATAETLYWIGVCYSELGDYEKSIECYQKIVDDWPAYEYTWHAQFMVGRCYEELKSACVIEKSVADEKIKAAYQKVIQNYPDCQTAGYAQDWLEKYLEKYKEK